MQHGNGITATDLESDEWKLFHDFELRVHFTTTATYFYAHFKPNLRQCDNERLHVLVCCMALILHAFFCYPNTYSSTYIRDNYNDY